MSKSIEYKIKMELLQYSYWEHYKFAKDLSFVLPLKHPKRIKIEKEINKIQQEIQAQSCQTQNQ